MARSLLGLVEGSRRLVARILGGAAVAFVTTTLVSACSAAPDDAGTSSEALQDGACPMGLFDLVVRDDDHKLLVPRVAESCVNLANGPLKGSAELESYMSSHPFVRLDKPSDYVGSCAAQYEAKTGRHLTEEQRVAAVSSYYFLMNTIKQAGLSTLEAIAGLEMLLDPLSPVLPETTGVQYRHPLIHESGDWAARLRRQCDGAPQLVEAIVELTTQTVWNVRKLSAAQDEAQVSGRDVDELANINKMVKAIEDAKQGVIKAGAPWLLGKDMEYLLRADRSLGQMVALEKAWNLVDDKGKVRPSSEWKAGDDHPLRVIERDVRASLPKQMQHAHERLIANYGKVIDAADWLHEKRERELDDDKFQPIMDGLTPFDPNVFSTFYDSEKFTKAFSIPALQALEHDVRTLAGTIKGVMLSPAAVDTLDVLQQLDAVGQWLGQLDAANAQTDAFRKRLDALRVAYGEARSGLSAQSELHAASCRNALRSSRKGAEDAIDDFFVGATLTIATMGAGSWLAAARAAASVGDAASVGTAWANAARVSPAVARGAQILAENGAAYDAQAKVLWGVLLSSDAFWVGDAAVKSVISCNKLVNQNVMKLFDIPFDRTRPTCLEASNGLNREVIAKYMQCVTQVAVSVGLNAVAGLSIAKDIQRGPLPDTPH